MVAVTMAVPAPVVFKVLPLLILAPVVPALLTDQTIVWLVALLGVTVPLKVRGVPTVAVVGTLVIPDTATKVVPLILTVTVKVCV